MDTPASRSRIMRSIRKKDTKPEIAVRRLLHAMGLRFRLHRRDLPGSPDIVLPRHKAVILVHGCFWHQHAGCHHANVPQVRPEYWLPKLARNVQRDAEAAAALQDLGWGVLTIWECQIKDQAALRSQIKAFLFGSEQSS